MAAVRIKGSTQCPGHPQCGSAHREAKDRKGGVAACRVCRVTGREGRGHGSGTAVLSPVGTSRLPVTFGYPPLSGGHPEQEMVTEAPGLCTVTPAQCLKA